MLRRVIGVSSLAGRSVSTFNFGHPDLDKEFMPRSNFKSAKNVDGGAVKITATAPAPEITVMSNGARLITQQRDGAVAAVGIYAEAGAKYDPYYAPGLNYVLRWALMTSNMDSTLFQIDRSIRVHGASFEHQEIRKKHIGWKLEARGDSWKKPFEHLCVGMAIPRFPEFDVERFRDTMDNLLEEQRWQNPRAYCVDQLESVAFPREPLGSFRMVRPLLNDEASHEKLLDQWCKFCVPERITVAGVNVSHAELLAAYEDAPYSHSSSAPHHANAAKVAPSDPLLEETQYAGGSEGFEQEGRAKAMGTKPNMEKETIAAVGFRTFGRDLNIKWFASALVLQQLSDMVSGDAVRVARHASHLGFRSFYRPFSGVGLTGFTIRTNSMDECISGVNEGVKMWRHLPVDESSVAVAVQRAATNFYHSELEYNRDYLDFVATSLSAKGTTHVTAEQVVSTILSIKAADVERALAVVRSERPVLFATGETLGFPSLRQMGL